MHKMLSGFRNWSVASSKRRQLATRYCVFIVTLFTAAMGNALPLDSVTSSECVRGDCENGSGTLELKTEFGKGFYRGEF